MLKLDRANSRIQMLSSKTLAEGKILERYDLQKMIISNPDAFFDEMGERLVLVGQEVKASDYVNDSIDLLAIDESGVAVVIELKRHEFKLQLFQAMSYAAMLSDWSADDFFPAQIVICPGNARRSTFCCA
jgi:RecB family endonuclease NucS